MTGSTDRLVPLGGGDFLIRNARASFLHVFKPQENDRGEMMYRGTFLIDQSRTDLIADLEDQIDDAARKKWGKTLPFERTCLGNGDDKDYDGYQGMMYISASERTRPQVLDRDRSPLRPEDGRPYSGCYVNVIVSFWCLDHPKSGKRVCANLRGVQFVKDGDAFSSAPPLDPSAFPEEVDPEDYDRASGGRSRDRGDRGREDRSARGSRDRGRDEEGSHDTGRRERTRTREERDDEFRRPPRETETRSRRSSRGDW